MIGHYVALMLGDVLWQVVQELQPQPWNSVNELGYAEAIKLLVRHQPKTAFARAVLVRQQAEEGGYAVRALYLNGDHQPLCRFDGSPYGYKVRVQCLDSELEEAFGDGDIVVVE